MQVIVAVITVAHLTAAVVTVAVITAIRACISHKNVGVAVFTGCPFYWLPIFPLPFFQVSVSSGCRLFRLPNFPIAVITVAVSSVAVVAVTEILLNIHITYYIFISHVTGGP